MFASLIRPSASPISWTRRSPLMLPDVFTTSGWDWIWRLESPLTNSGFRLQNGVNNLLQGEVRCRFTRISLSPPSRTLSCQSVLFALKCIYRPLGDVYAFLCYAICLVNKGSGCHALRKMMRVRDMQMVHFAKILSFRCIVSIVQISLTEHSRCNLPVVLLNFINSTLDEC